MNAGSARRVVADLSEFHRTRPKTVIGRVPGGQGCRNEAAAAIPGAAGFQPPAAEYRARSAAAESWALLRSLRNSAARRRIALLAAGLVFVLVGNMAGQIRLNRWQGAFFDAVTRRDLGALGTELLVFLAVIGVLLALVVAQTWMQQMLKVRLR